MTFKRKHMAKPWLGREHNSWSKELWIDLIWFLGSVSFNFALLLPVNSCNNIKE